MLAIARREIVPHQMYMVKGLFNLYGVSGQTLRLVTIFQGGKKKHIQQSTGFGGFSEFFADPPPTRGQP